MALLSELFDADARLESPVGHLDVFRSGVVNAFCPTGEGGGVDPTCGSGDKGVGGRLKSILDEAKGIQFGTKRMSGGTFKKGHWGYELDDVPTLEFSTSAGGSYKVYATDVSANPVGKTNINFTDSSGKLGVTGSGGAHEVFSRATAAVVSYMDHKSPHSIQFSAAEPSRQKLYERLAKSISKIKPDWQSSSVDVGDKVIFLLHKRTDEARAKVKEYADLYEVPVKTLNRASYGLVENWLATNAWVSNVFCSTGEGGGVDPTCSKGGGASSGKAGDTSTSAVGDKAEGKPGAAHSRPARTPNNLNVTYGGDDGGAKVKELVKKTFGSDIDPAKLAAAANATDGGQVTIGTSPSGRLVEVVVRNPGGSEAKRTFYKDHTGALTVSNDAFNNKNKQPGGPSGAQIMLDQVKALRDLGVKKIVTQAEGSRGDPDKYVGYTVWPKLGYDGAMSDKQFDALPPDIKAKMGAKKGGLFGLGKQKGDRSVLALHQIPGGPEAWAEHGSTFAGVFDLSDGSRNMKHLDNYAAKKGLTSNSDPDQPRDKFGRWTTTGAAQEFQKGMYNSEVGAFVGVNAFLRHGTVSQHHKTSKEDLEDLVAAIDAGFTKSDKDQTVFRGIRHWDKLAGDAKAGDVITDKGYNSSDTKKGKAEEFAKPVDMSDRPMLMEIRVPAGTKTAKVADLTGKKVGIGKAEDEVLLPRGTRYKIVSVTQPSGMTAKWRTTGKPGKVVLEVVAE